MSEAAVEESPNGLMLDGEMPRLGATPLLAQAPTVVPSSDAPSLPVVSPLLTDQAAPVLPTPTPSNPALTPNLPAPSLPSLEKQSLVDLATAVGAEETDKVVERRHPMAHLMPEKLKPSEASLRAAEQRAAKKKKAKKIKIAATIGALAVTAVVGPPLGRWLIDAVNEAGSTESDEPAVESDQDVDAGDPAATPAAGLDAIEDLENLVSGSTVPATP